MIDVSLDLSGRPFVVWEVELPECLPLGQPAFDPQLAEHAVSSFATAAGITLHVELVRGRNVHHIIEATFKGLAQVPARRGSGRQRGRRPVDEGRPVSRPLPKPNPRTVCFKRSHGPFEADRTEMAGS